MRGIKNMKRRRKNNRVNILILIIIIVLLISLCLFIYIKYKKYNDDKYNINDIEEHYGETVKVNSDATIYTLVNGQYIEKGKVYENTILNLGKQSDNNNQYFLITNFNNDYYIYYKYVNPTNDKITKNERYKKYIPFNENITGENLKLYKDNNLVLSLYEKVSLPIYIKEDNKYYVDYADDLYEIKKDNVSIEKVINTNEQNISKIGVLNYHFFWDDEEENINDCNQVICHSKTQFKTHLDYIRENNILTLQMNELEKWIDGKIQLPKSVVITIDDGWKAELGIKMLNEYQMYGTLFLITSQYDPKYYENKYVELHSHTDNLHVGGKCPGGQGGGIKCLPHDEVLNDLTTSREKLNGSTVLCYPFYEFNDYSIKLAKEAGFTMAFAGESSFKDNHVKQASEKYSLPRFVVVTYTSMNDFANFVG